MPKPKTDPFQSFVCIIKCNGRRKVKTIQCRETPAFFIDEDGYKYKKTKADSGESLVAFRKSGDKWYEYTYSLFYPEAPEAIRVIKQETEGQYMREIRSQIETHNRYLTFEQAKQFDALFRSMKTGEPYDTCYQAVLDVFDKE